MAIKLYRTGEGAFLEQDRAFYRFPCDSWAELINGTNLQEEVLARPRSLERVAGVAQIDGLLPPIAPGQEVWAAGVTYRRSREARMEESESTGGANFYDRVYDAERPELFFKANPHRVVGHGASVRIRRDSRWNVPEPELTLVLSSDARIVGYTVGNDVSSRDIEGENPLYLPQAKVYDGSCALGPGILVADGPLPSDTEIRLEVLRRGSPEFAGTTRLSNMKRSLQTLIEFLFRDNRFPLGCFLMTGTGIVPPNSFTLQPRDEVRITIDPIGTLINTVN